MTDIPDTRSSETTVIQSMVMDMLENWMRYDWTIQGFGMLRTKLPGDVRLNLWHPEYEYSPKPSLMHNHPWDFTSYILAGSLVNVRYSLADVAEFPLAIPMRQVRLKPGKGTTLLTEPENVWVIPDSPRLYFPGDRYGQRYNELHVSHTILPGTVTLNKRERQERPDEAVVLYDPDLEWVTAEPREATPSECYRFVSAARRQLKLDMF